MDQACLITGAGGSIGSEIAKQVVNLNSFSTVYINDISEASLFACLAELQDIVSSGVIETKVIPLLGDISQFEVLSVLRKHPIDIKIIYHAAAYKHVNMSMSNPLIYFKNNIESTRQIIELANAINAQLIHISTDKAVWPTNNMGRSKRICEFLYGLEKYKNETCKIVRFGNVLNSSGSVIPIFEKQILNGGPVTVTDPLTTRYLMSISEAVSLVLRSSVTTKSAKINILDMGQPVLIDDLARNLILDKGLHVVDKKTMSTEIVIEYIGLRPGEKLHEELSYGCMEETNCIGIMKANEHVVFDDKVIDELIEKIYSEDWAVFDNFDWQIGQFR